MVLSVGRSCLLPVLLVPLPVPSILVYGDSPYLIQGLPLPKSSLPQQATPSHVSGFRRYPIVSPVPLSRKSITWESTSHHHLRIALQ